MRRRTIALLLLIAGCSAPVEEECTDCIRIVSDYEKVDTQIPFDRIRNTTHPNSGESWTVMIYASADNDLESAISDDLRELLAVDTNDSLEILVQADLSDRHGSDLPVGTTPKWSTAKRFRVEDNALIEISDLGELDSSSPAVLADFMVWASQEAPADRYAIVMMSHGFGWSRFGLDESHGTSFEIADLAVAFDTAIDQSDSLREFALIGFDACISASVEMAVNLSPFGEYLLASQHNEPGHGWEYGAFSVLSDDPRTSPIKLAESIAAQFVARGESEGEIELTLSLIDLYQGRRLQRTLSDFAIRLSSDKNTAFTRKLRQTRHFPNLHPRPTFLFDLGDMLARLGAPDTFGSQVDPLRTALDEAVVFSSTGARVSAANGLSIYAPTSSDDFDPKYDGLGAVTSWAAHLHNIHAWQNTFDLAFLGAVDQTVEGTETVYQGILSSGSEIATVAYTTLQLANGPWILDVPTTIDGEFVRGRWDGRALYDSNGDVLFGTHISGEEYLIPLVQRSRDGTDTDIFMHRYGPGQFAFRRRGETFGEFVVDSDATFYPFGKIPDYQRPLSLQEIGWISPAPYTGPAISLVEMIVRGGNQTETAIGLF